MTQLSTCHTDKPVGIPPSHGWYSALTRQFSRVDIPLVSIQAQPQLQTTSVNCQQKVHYYT